MGSLLRFLLNEGRPPRHRSLLSEGCRVIVETEYMDLCTECDEPERFAVLIEDKVNGAVDQHMQLSGYVTKLLAKGSSPERSSSSTPPSTAAGSRRPMTRLR